MATIKPVAQWQSYEDVVPAVQAGLPTDYEVNRKLVEDHDAWQSGTLWLGHRTGDGVVDAAMRVRIEPQFVADDVVGELIDNRSNGLLGQEADVQLQPLEDASETESDAQEERAAGGLTGLATWWDRERYWERIGDAVDRVSYATRAAVVPFVADADLLDGRLQPGKSLADALAVIHLEAPRPDRAVRYIDPTTQRPVAIVLRTITGADGRETERAEVYAVNPQSKATEVRIFTKGAAVTAAVPVGLGGRLPIGEARANRILTEPMRRLQSLVNFIVTVTARSVETAGFRSVHVTNAEPHLLWLTSKPASTPVVAMLDRNGFETKVASEAVSWGVATPPVFGAGVLNEWQGIRTNVVGSSGTVAESFESPSITALDPVDPSPMNLTADAVRAVMFQRAKQGHLALDSTVQSSGTAYQQARAQHEADLKRLKSPVEGMIRDSLEAVLALAAEMSDEAKALLAEFRVAVNLRISAGPVTTTDVTDAVTLRDKGLIATTTAMARVGVEDPAAEQATIDEDPAVRAAKWTAIATAIKALEGIPDATTEGAALLLGVTLEEIAILKTVVGPTEQQPAPKLVA